MANLKNLKVLNIGDVDYNVGFSTNDLTDELLSKLNGIEDNAQVNIIEKIRLNGEEIAVNEKLVDLGSLQKSLTAGSGISISADGTISTTLDVEAFKVVDELPSAPAAGNESKIHVVPNSNGSEGNMYNEYLWDGSKWELLGEFKAEMDLSDYAKTSDVNTAIEESRKNLQANIDEKVDKVDGKGLSTNDYTTAEKEKLAGITAGANKVTSAYDESTATLTLSIE